MTSTTIPSTESTLPLNTSDPIEEKNRTSGSDKLTNAAQRQNRRRTTKRTDAEQIPKPRAKTIERAVSTTDAVDQSNTLPGVKRHRMIKSSSFQMLPQTPDKVEHDEQANASPRTPDVASVVNIPLANDEGEGDEQQPIVSGEHLESNTDGTESFSQSTPDSQQELDLLIGSFPKEEPRESSPRNCPDSQLIRSQLILMPFEEMELGEPCRRRSTVHGGQTNTSMLVVSAIVVVRR